MLVFNLFGKKDTECIRFERYFLSMGNCLEDFWSIMRKDMNGFSREEEEAFIGEYKNVLIVMSESYMTDINVLYYMDILRSLKEKGHINIVAMIQNGTVIPERYRWITGPEVSWIAFYYYLLAFMCQNLYNQLCMIIFIIDYYLLCVFFGGDY